MGKLLEQWKATAMAAAVLLGMVWGAVTWADEVVRNAKDVPALKMITAKNAEQIKLLIEREKHRDSETLRQNAQIIRMLEDIQNDRS